MFNENDANVMKFINHCLDCMEQTNKELFKPNFDISDLDRIYYYYDNRLYTIRMWNICEVGISFSIYTRNNKDEAETLYRGQYIFN